MRAKVSRLLGWARLHRLLASFLAVALVAGGFYAYRRVFGGSTATTYALETVATGTLVASVSVSGQVAASRQVDIHPKVSGEIVSVLAKVGAAVHKGDVLARLDSGDAQISVSDARTDVETAELDLDELLHPDDALARLRASHSLSSAEESVSDARDALQRSHDSLYDALNDAVGAAPGIIDTTNRLLNNSLASPHLADLYIQQTAGAGTYARKEAAVASFSAAERSYRDAARSLRDLPRSATADELAGIARTMTSALTDMADALTAAVAFVDQLQAHASDVDLSAQRASLRQQQAAAAGAAADVQSAQRAYADADAAVTKAGRSLSEEQLSYQDATGGPDASAVRAARITLQKRQNALAAASETLSRYTVRAPFDGIVAASEAQVGDDASASTVIATLVTAQDVASVTLTETDVSKVREGQKATLTFDALPDLQLTGTVIAVNLAGSVSQGVVSYAAKVGFDADSEQVRPGMSVTASIITESRADTLIVPSSAVKASGDASYVELLPDAVAADGGLYSSSGGPQRQAVEVGLSSDTETEILSGLAAGDRVVTRTVTPSASAASTARTSGSVLGGGGVRAGGGFGGGLAR